MLLSGKELFAPEEYLCYLGIWHGCSQKTEACNLTPWSFTAMIWQPLPLKSNTLHGLRHFFCILFFFCCRRCCCCFAFITSLVNQLHPPAPRPRHGGSSRLGDLPRGSCTVTCDAVLYAYSWILFFIYIMAWLETWARNCVWGCDSVFFMVISMHDGLRLKTLWLVPTCAVEFASLSHTRTQTHYTQTHKHSVAFLQLLQEVWVIYFCHILQIVIVFICFEKL